LLHEEDDDCDGGTVLELELLYVLGELVDQVELLVDEAVEEAVGEVVSDVLLLDQDPVAPQPEPWP
jgi:hypothetical protein